MAGYKPWYEQLKDPRWQKKRLEIMNRDRFECICCGEEKGLQLHVHHTYYEKGKAPWEYPNESLETLCEECHKMKKDIDDKFSESLKYISTEAVGYHDKDYFRGIIDGMRLCNTDDGVFVLIRLENDDHMCGVADGLSIDIRILERFAEQHIIDTNIFMDIREFCKKYGVFMRNPYTDDHDKEMQSIEYINRSLAAEGR